MVGEHRGVKPPLCVFLDDSCVGRCGRQDQDDAGDRTVWSRAHRGVEGHVYRSSGSGREAGDAEPASRRLEWFRRSMYVSIILLRKRGKNDLLLLFQVSGSVLPLVSKVGSSAHVLSLVSKVGSSLLQPARRRLLARELQ